MMGGINMFDSEKIKLTEVGRAGENKYSTFISFKELKEMVDLGKIKIDSSIDVPYVPLVNEDILYLNIDKDLLTYDVRVRELSINGQFSVMDGAIRLINFINLFSDYSEKNLLDKKVELQVSCYSTNEIRNLFSNSEKK
jgi:hypothetical protein